MRRLVPLALAALTALIMVGCGTNSRAHLWATNHHAPIHSVRGRFADYECVSADCGPWSTTLNWQIPSFPGQTGYWLFLNGTKVGAASAPPFTFRGWDCGTTDTLGVEAHDASGNHGALWTMSHTAPSCTDPATIHVAQTAAGSGDGSSCSNAEPYTWFNTAANWGAGKPIAPGTTVGLCGTITGAGGNAAVLTAQGSGTSGNPVTVYWEPGASVQAPYCYASSSSSGPGCVNLNSQSYITLNGGSNGSIKSTANGYNEPNGQTYTLGVWAGGSSHDITIENLNISNMWYLNGSISGIPSGSCTADTGTSSNGVWIGSGSNMTIKDDTFQWERSGVTWYPVGASQANVDFDGNTMSNLGTSVNFVENTNGGGSVGPVFFRNNTVSSFAPWETGSSACVHDDGIHGYDTSGFTPMHFTGWYIYNNRWSGMGAGFAGDATGYLFFESSSTSATDATSPIYVFNNVFSGEESNAEAKINTGTPYVYNNTFVGTSTAEGACLQPYLDANADGQLNGAATVENDAFTGCGQLVDMTSSSAAPSVLPAAWDYNVYDAGTSLAWKWGTSTDAFSTTGFSAWKTSVSGDSHSCSTFGTGTGACAGGQTSVNLNTDGSPQAGSPVLGAGTNLTSLCTGDLTPLCTEINGTARPSSGAWDAGAY